MAQPAPLPPHHPSPSPPPTTPFSYSSCYLVHSSLQPVTCHRHTEGQHVARASMTAEGNFTFTWANSAASHTHVWPHPPWAPPPMASASKNLAICPAYHSPMNTQWNAQRPEGWQGTGSAWAGDFALLGVCVSLALAQLLSCIMHVCFSKDKCNEAIQILSSGVKNSKVHRWTLLFAHRVAPGKLLNLSDIHFPSLPNGIK